MHHTRPNGFPEFTFRGREGKTLQLSPLRDQLPGPNVAIAVLTINATGYAFGPAPSGTDARTTVAVTRSEGLSLVSGLDTALQAWEGLRAAVLAPIVIADADGSEWLRVEASSGAAERDRELRIHMRKDKAPEFGKPIDVMSLGAGEAARFITALADALDRDAMSTSGAHALRLVA